MERHDVYNTFSSVLQIMLIAKQQLITQVDEEKNLVMSRKDCKLIDMTLTNERTAEYGAKWGIILPRTGWRWMKILHQLSIDGDAGCKFQTISHSE